MFSINFKLNSSIQRIVKLDYALIASKEKEEKKVDHPLGNVERFIIKIKEQLNVLVSTLSNEPLDNQFLDLDGWSREACKGRKKGRGAVYQPCSCTGWLQWSFAALATHSAITLQSPSSRVTVASKRGFTKIHLFPPSSFLAIAPTCNVIARNSLTCLFLSSLALPMKRRLLVSAAAILPWNTPPFRFCGFALAEWTELSSYASSPTNTRAVINLFEKRRSFFSLSLFLKGNFVSDS